MNEPQEVLINFWQVEFDQPSQLLKKDNGFFRFLVDESGNREALYAAARA